MSKKIEKEVKKELKNIQSPENSVAQNISKAQDEYELLIKSYEEELNRVNKEAELINRFDILKTRFVHLYTSGQYTNRQLARILKVSEGTITKWLREPEIVDMIVAYQQKENIIIDASLKALRLKAVQKASDLLDADNEMVQAIVVRDILDRTGHKAVEKKEVNVNLTYEERLNKLLQDASNIIDAEIIYDNNEENNSEGEIKGDL